MRETEAASQAFNDYLSLGKDRSLESLAVRYESAEDAPTRSIHTLKRWSEEHDWQARVDKHVAETNALVLKRMKTDMAGVRVRRLKLVGKALESIQVQVEKGTPVDPKDLTKLVEAEFKLYGEPLPDRTEVTGKGGGPLNIDLSMIPSLSEETCERIIKDLGSDTRDGSSQGDH